MTNSALRTTPDAPALRSARAGFLLLLLSLPVCASAQTTGGLVAGQAPIRAGTKILILSIPDGRESHGNIGGGSGAAVLAGLRQELVGHGMIPFDSDSGTLTEPRRCIFESRRAHHLKPTEGTFQPSCLLSADTIQ
jgi:hypothetical protein